MMIFIYRNENRETLAPLCCRRSLADLKMAGTTVNDIITTRWEAAVTDFADNRILSAPLAFWPSKELLAELAGHRENYILVDADRKPLAWLNVDQSIPEGAPEVLVDEKSFVNSLKQADQVITMEDNIVKGALGSNIEELMVKEHIQVDLKKIGYPDEFIPHGSVKELEDLYLFK